MFCLACSLCAHDEEASDAQALSCVGGNVSCPLMMRCKLSKQIYCVCIFGPILCCVDVAYVYKHIHRTWVQQTWTKQT